MQHATIELTGIATTVNVTQLSAATQWTICFIHDLQWAQNTKTTKIKKRFFPECCGFVAWNSIKILTTTCIIQMLYHVFDLHKRVCKCWCRWFRPMPRKVSNDLIIPTGRVEKKKKKTKRKKQKSHGFPFAVAGCRDHNYVLQIDSFHHILLFVWSLLFRPNNFWMKKQFHERNGIIQIVCRHWKML